MIVKIREELLLLFAVITFGSWIPHSSLIILCEDPLPFITAFIFQARPRPHQSSRVLCFKSCFLSLIPGMPEKGVKLTKRKEVFTFVGVMTQNKIFFDSRQKRKKALTVLCLINRYNKYYIYYIILYYYIFIFTIIKM